VPSVLCASIKSATAFLYNSRLVLTIQSLFDLEFTQLVSDPLELSPELVSWCSADDGGLLSDSDTSRMAEPKSITSMVNPQISSPTAIKSSKMQVPEVVGILSQSLHPSPTIRLILPARIRCKAQNDVVFVGEDFIQLREFLPTGQLADVTAKVDLGSQILSAKVISSQIHAESLVDQIIKQELDEDYCGINGSDQVTLPPQLLVVSTVACNIVFLFAKNRAPGVVEFVFAKRKLLADAPVEGQYAKHVAVDHE
jgi:hypothetical protein